MGDEVRNAESDYCCQCGRWTETGEGVRYHSPERATVYVRCHDRSDCLERHAKRMRRRAKFRADNPGVYLD